MHSRMLSASPRRSQSRLLCTPTAFERTRYWRETLTGVHALIHTIKVLELRRQRHTLAQVDFCKLSSCMQPSLISTPPLCLRPCFEASKHAALEPVLTAWLRSGMLLNLLWCSGWWHFCGWPLGGACVARSSRNSEELHHDVHRPVSSWPAGGQSWGWPSWLAGGQIPGWPSGGGTRIAR